MFVCVCIDEHERKVNFKYTSTHIYLCSFIRMHVECLFTCLYLSKNLKLLTIHCNFKVLVKGEEHLQ